MSLLHLAIISPFILAIIVPIFYKYFRKIHTGWLFFHYPFYYLVTSYPFFQLQNTIELMETMPWIPSLGIDFKVMVDGLGLTICPINYRNWCVSRILFHLLFIEETGTT